MEKLKCCLLIGGPRDGFRIGLTEKEIARWNPLYVSIPEPISIYEFKTFEDLPPEAPAPKHAVYLPEILRGQQIEVIFYRHEDLPLDHALMKLFERYPQESAESSR